MGLFGSRRKLEAERIARQRVENELTEARRQQAFQDDQVREERERQRQELEMRNQAAKVLETKLAEEREENRRREEVARIEEAERRQRQLQRERMEREKVEKERQREQDRQNKMRQASPETLRDLRELIRNRYELDVKIWALRNARRPDRPIVQTKMDQADAIMDEILLMMELWGDNSDKRWNTEEWAKVEVIRKKIRDGGYRTWAENPPWN